MASKDEAAKPIEWTVTGMDCASCATKIRTAVERLPGAESVDIALMTERLKVRLDEAKTPRDKVEAAVKSLGYGIAERKGPAAAAASAPQPPILKRADIWREWSRRRDVVAVAGTHGKTTTVRKLAFGSTVPEKLTLQVGHRAVPFRRR